MMATLKSIQDEIESLKDAVADAVGIGVKHVIKLPLWVKIVAGVVLIILIIQIWSMFKKREPVDNSYLQKIDQLQEKVQLQTEKIDALQQGQSLRDSIIYGQLEAIKNNRPTQTRIIHQYDKVPNDVHSLDKSGLRREVTEY